MRDTAIEHLIMKAAGRDSRQESEDRAVNRLLAHSDPSYREPSHQENDAVQFLAGLTMAELRKNGR